jgi:hypothetical protein
MRLDASGNLGLGVTPSAWSSSWKAFEFAAAAIAWTGAGANDFSFSTNSFFDSTDSRWEYKSTGDGAARYSMTALTGQHRWFTAPIGTAGAAISFTQVMTLNTSGNLSIGNTNDTYKLDVTGQIRVNGSTNEQLIVDYTIVSGGFTWQSFRLNGTNRYRIFGNTDNSFTLWSDVLSSNVLSIASTGAATFSSSVTANYGGTFIIPSESPASGNVALIAKTSNGANDIFRWYDGATQLGVFKNSGNVGIGTNSPVANLHVTGVCGAGSSGSFSIAAPASGGGCPSYFIMGNNDSAGVAGPNVIMSANRQLLFGLGNSFSSSTGGTFSELMRITSDGNVGIGTSSPISKLTVDNTTNNIWLSINNGRNSGSSPTYGLSITTSHASSSLNDVNHYGAYIVPNFTTSSSNLGSVYGMFIQPTESGFYNIGYGYGLYVKAITVNSGTISNNYAAVFMGGNVGIGTVTPSYLLDVHSSAGGSFSTIRSNNGFTGASDGSQILLGNSANFTNAYFRLNGGGNSSQAGIGSLNIGVTEAVPMAFYTSNSERMRITSGGNVGIGCTDPTSINITGANYPVLQIRDGVGDGQLRVGGVGDGTVGLLLDYDNSAYTTTTIRSLYGATSNDAALNIDAGYITFRTGTSFSERMRITSGGDVLVNATATTQGAKFYVNGIGAFGSVYVGALGTGTVYSNAGFLTNTNPSDRRLKTNIIPLTYGLSDILKLNPVSYNWKDGTNGKQFGFIAQEVQEIMPDAVKDGEYLGLEKDAIYSALVNAIKELKQELDTLKNK